MAWEVATAPWSTPIQWRCGGRVAGPIGFEVDESPPNLDSRCVRTDPTSDTFQANITQSQRHDPHRLVHLQTPVGKSLVRAFQSIIRAAFELWLCYTLKPLGDSKL